MDKLTLEVKNVKKEFNRRVIFDRISFELSTHDSLSVTGRNGSGKSTLVKIISGVLSPTAGSVILNVNGTSIPVENRRRYLGFVAPYLQLYDEFTGYENLALAARIRGRREDNVEIERLLSLVGLLNCKDDRVGTYSSGMKQRLKYAFALLHRPPLLILDEPMSNLDQNGIDFVRHIIEVQKKNGILIVATNDVEEARMCDQNVNLDTVNATLKGKPLDDIPEVVTQKK